MFPRDGLAGRTVGDLTKWEEWKGTLYYKASRNDMSARLTRRFSLAVCEPALIDHSYINGAKSLAMY